MFKSIQTTKGSSEERLKFLSEKLKMDFEKNKTKNQKINEKSKK